MILRALFWIGVVSLLMPREPDLGFGRPSSGLSAVTPQGVAGLMHESGADSACTGTACRAGLSVLGTLHSFGVRSIEDVRADLKANRTPLRGL